MPMSEEDKARLAPMVLNADILAGQKQSDMREFRKYLVDTGTVKCLVKLYEHIARNEMRLDNPHILTEFLANYQDGQFSQVDETEHLMLENEKLREHNTEMEAQIEELQSQVYRTGRLLGAERLWRLFVAPEFWEDTGVDPSANRLSLQQLYTRLCGKEYEPKIGQALTTLARPRLLKCDAAKVPIPQETFCEWLAFRAPAEVYDWCTEELFPRTGVLHPTEAPFEAELIEAIRSSSVWPERPNAVLDIVSIDPKLQVFLTSVAEDFGCRLSGRNSRTSRASRSVSRNSR